MPGYGLVRARHEPDGRAPAAREITEFTNAGIIVGLATVNLAADPFNDFNGFWGACSTYGSFSYLKYGPMRLFSQLAQDCELKVGKVLWVAGHSGPETAEDSRTHFGIFETGRHPALPRGHVIDLHPWEYNEVPVVLAAALATDVPIVALHLTRPADRDPRPRGARHAVALRGGARRLRAPRLQARPAARRHGLRPGHDVDAPTSSRSCPSSTPGPQREDRRRVSPQLFARQPRLPPVRHRARRPARRHGDHQPRVQADARLGRRPARPPEYSLSPDWDDRWRTGGTVDEVIDEAHLTTRTSSRASSASSTSGPTGCGAFRELLDGTE